MAAIGGATVNESQFTWGDSVRVVERDGAHLNWRPGSVGSVCGFRTIQTAQQASSSSFAIGTILYTVEFEDGQSAEIPEEVLERID
jgi:hypothetical protein